MLRRLIRIAPPYYVALLTFAALAFTRFGLPTWPLDSPPPSAQLLALAQDLLFLTSAHPIHNCDFWTLGVEMRWYLLFPIMLGLYVRSRLKFACVMLVIYGLYATPWGPADFGMYPCFMLGIVAADIAYYRPAWAACLWAPALFVLGVAIWLQSRTTDVDHGSVVWHCAMFLTVVAVTNTDSLARIFSNRALVAIGAASYSIYLVHHPIISELAIRGMAAPWAGVFSVAIGFVFFSVVERPLGARSIRERIDRVVRSPFAGLQRSS